MDWEDSQKGKISSYCGNQDTNATKLCECVNNSVFKTYAFDRKVKKYKEFTKETKEDCLNDS